jgi:hypothetical protein
MMPKNIQNIIYKKGKMTALEKEKLLKWTDDEIKRLTINREMHKISDRILKEDRDLFLELGLR